MTETSPDRGGPSIPRRRGPLLLAAGSGVLLVVVVIIVAALRCGGEDPAPAGEADLGVAQGADGATSKDAAPPGDLARAKDLVVERSRRPRGTRIIGSRELRRVQRRYRGLVKLCYDRATRRGSGLVPRKIDITVSLADRGRVRRVKASAGGTLGACVRRMVRGWRFSSSLKAQKVRFSFVFAR